MYDWNESVMKYQGSARGTNAAPGTEWSENGNHILQAHGQSIRYVFYFLQQLMGGGELLRFFGQRSGAKAFDICAAIIHNGVIGVTSK